MHGIADLRKQAGSIGPRWGVGAVAGGNPGVVADRAPFDRPGLRVAGNDT